MRLGPFELRELRRRLLALLRRLVGLLGLLGGVGGEVRGYKTADGARAATLTGHEGAVFAVTFTPEGQRVITGGFDGLIRIFNPADSKLIGVLLPVPLTPAKQVVSR